MRPAVAIAVAVALLLGACGRDPAPSAPSSGPDPASDGADTFKQGEGPLPSPSPAPSVSPDPPDPADPADPADPDPDPDAPLADEHTHDHPLAPPVAVDAALPEWTPADAPDLATHDRRARDWLDDLADGALADRVDATHGVLYDDADGGEPRRLRGEHVAEVTGPLGVALGRAGAEARCRAGVCVVTDGATRWFVALQRRAEGEPVLAAVLRASGGWPATGRYLAWREATRAPWQEPAFGLLGDGLSAAEAGKYEQALDALTRAHRLDPDNPWPLYYTARAEAARKQYERAYIALRLLAEHPSPIAMTARLRLDREYEFVRFRTHTAVIDVQRELTLPPPSAVGAFLAYLRRFRAASERLGGLIAEGGPETATLAGLLEARLLDEPAVTEEPPSIAWRGAAIRLARDADGALRVDGVDDETP